jgi:hypothetical protein
MHNILLVQFTLTLLKEHQQKADFNEVLLERGGVSYTTLVHNDPLDNYQQTLGGVLLSHLS